jgi:hypothetical protein
MIIRIALGAVLVLAIYWVGSFLYPGIAATLQFLSSYWWLIFIPMAAILLTTSEIGRMNYARRRTGIMKQRH